jgi:hypothetical protein
VPIALAVSPTVPMPAPPAAIGHQFDWGAASSSIGVGTWASGAACVDDAKNKSADEHQVRCAHIYLRQD